MKPTKPTNAPAPRFAIVVPGEGSGPNVCPLGSSGWRLREVETTLKFRQAVGREFEHLVHDGVPVAELMEVDESELDAAEKIFAEAQR